MQRNMLLAVALSILIMIVWTRFFAPEPQQRQRPGQQQPGQVTEQTPGQVEDFTLSPDEFAAPAIPIPAPAPEPLFAEELAKAQDVVVQNEHIAATFTTFGGRLTSLRLIEFDSKRYASRAVDDIRCRCLRRGKGRIERRRSSGLVA